MKHRSDMGSHSRMWGEWAERDGVYSQLVVAAYIPAHNSLPMVADYEERRDALSGDISMGQV